MPPSEGQTSLDGNDASLADLLASVQKMEQADCCTYQRTSQGILSHNSVVTIKCVLSCVLTGVHSACSIFSALL